MHDENKLLERLKSFVLAGESHRQYAHPPVTESDVIHAEAIIGFALPPLLKRIYLEVGNGGFGPGYGLLPLNNEEDPEALHTDSLVTIYLATHTATKEQMEVYRRGDAHAPPLLPEKLFMLCDWGCNIYSWLDCSQAALPVLKSEATLDWRQFVLEAPSLQTWLKVWLDSTQHSVEEKP